MSTLNYCRFCAQEKEKDHLTAIKPQDRTTITEKLSLFGALVDFSDRKLPNTMCIKCSELIDVSYNFLLKVKRSQVVLRERCCLDLDTEALHGDMFTNFNIKEESDHEDYLQDDLLSPNIKDSKKTESQVICDASLEVVSSWGEYPWRCALCPAEGASLAAGDGASLAALRAHCAARHGTCLAAACADCTHQSDGFFELVAHIRTHRKELRKYCEYCNMKLENPTHIHKHTHTCSHCGYCFTDESSLTTHLHTYFEHKNRAKSMTEVFHSETFDLVNGHIPSWSEYPSVCKFCELKMVDGGVLRDHCVEVHRRCFGRRCVDCDDDDDVRCFDDFVKHVRIHRPFLKNVCPFCNSVDESHDVKQHTTNRHVCELCGDTFTRKRDLRYHQTITKPSPPLKPPKKRRKRTPADKDLTCDTCGRVMKTPVSLRAHLKTHFVRKRNYTCERCGKAYYTKGSLSAHTKIHDNIKNETCKICQKSFLTRPRLKKHVKTHNLEMPFQCDQCKRFFNSKDRLREHVKVHMDVMPFKCQYCSKTFRHKTMMRTHVNQHTGARPYSCNLCCMEFANWSNCNKHMKRRHGTTLAKNVMTPHGKLALNPATGRPDQLYMDSQVKEWSELMLMGREKIDRKKKTAAETNSVVSYTKSLVHT